MGLYLGKFKISILDKIKNLFLFVIFISSSLTLNLSGLFNEIVFAAEPFPICNKATIYGDGVENTVEIVLNCENIFSFGSGGIIADADDIDKIRLNYTRGRIKPISATMDALNGQITLKYLDSNQSIGDDIMIYAGALINDTGSFNENIYISPESISDAALPHAIDESYEFYLGADLIIPSGVLKGVLDNDYDRESTTLVAELETTTSYGALVFNGDGSFIYTPTDASINGDTFTYYVIDESGNRNPTFTTLISADTVVGGVISVNNSTINNYAKVGDTIRVDITATAPIDYKEDSGKIGGKPANYLPIDSTSFSIEYIMQPDDEEGEVYFSLDYFDRSGVLWPFSPENTYFIFDKTAPVIDLGEEGNEVELEVHSEYDHEASVTVSDNMDELVALEIEGDLNTEKAGIYELIYSATDQAGNTTKVFRTIIVNDEVSNEHVKFAERLLALGLKTNIDQVNVDNVYEFFDLYIEKIVDGKPVARITYNQPVDLSDEELINYLNEYYNRMDVSPFGSVSLDYDGFSDEFILRTLESTTKLYGLDKIGVKLDYSNEDIYKRITAYDLDGLELDKDYFFYNQGLISQCSEVYLNCIAYSIEAAYFVDFEIDNFAPVIVVDSIKDHKKGETVILSGTVDDTAKIFVIEINGQAYLSTTDNIDLKWLYQLGEDVIKTGKNYIKITAADIYGNESNVVVEFMVNGPEDEKNQDFNNFVYRSSTNYEEGDTLVYQDIKEVITIPDQEKVEKNKDDTSESEILAWYWWLIIISSSILVVWWMIESANSDNTYQKRRR